MVKLNRTRGSAEAKTSKLRQAIMSVAYLKCIARGLIHTYLSITLVAISGGIILLLASAANCCCDVEISTLVCRESEVIAEEELETSKGDENEFQGNMNEEVG